MLLEQAAALLQPHVPLEKEALLRRLETPPEPHLGDVAFPCFVLAKQLRRAPSAIAAELADAVAADAHGVRAEAASGYVNLFFDPAVWLGRIVDAALEPRFGRSDESRGRHVVIDMSSPNIAKPLGVGHLRSTMIGNALANLYRETGHAVTTVNHLGDWGTQFGKLIVAYGRWGGKSALEADPIGESLHLYVRFHEEAAKKPELEDEAREAFLRLEQGDEETTALWRFFVQASMKEFERVYARLGVRFDEVLGESFYNDKLAPVLDRLRAQGLLEESDGALVVRLDEEGLPPCLILKKDGATIYPVRDLATAIYRRQVMKADRLLYVVGAEQQLHFKQVFGVLGKMGEPWTGDCEHVPFGLMTVEGKKMSTRRGKVVFLDEVLDEAVRRAREIIAAKSPDLQDADHVAEAVGIGAVVFGDLKNRRLLSVDFKLEEVVSFDGETGPYVQYTHARIASLLRKGGFEQHPGQDGANGAPRAADERVDMADAAWVCAKRITQWSAAVREAVRDNEPSAVARYLLELARDFNRFYHDGKVIQPDDAAATQARLRLSAAVGHLLGRGLKLLGIAAPERM
ncbi:arginine--tRNA ligase [Cohnella ginsengisoli]|uniref:Arginine--tRNA ligase n=1 Tax=Cohnella ginsengisoli TaxID=425004 RepID=A0A9X4KSC5_9BACL|nr:arginine--tRNA ligase [Cohnella ginsengisoli]MDG0794745.1 arginine--tRNA ligase [Cohnella ginsengisoli]